MIIIKKALHVYHTLLARFAETKARRLTTRGIRNPSLRTKSEAAWLKRARHLHLANIAGGF